MPSSSFVLKEEMNKSHFVNTDPSPETNLARQAGSNKPIHDIARKYLSEVLMHPDSKRADRVAAAAGLLAEPIEP